MQRLVLEPILFAIFSELLYPTEPVEYVMPYSTVMELYDLLDTEQVVTDRTQDTRVKQHIEQLIAFFEQPFVRKKMDRCLRVPWQKSPPILFSEGVTLIIVNALDNAEFGESFDPVETELILTARREGLAIISDQLDFQQRITEAKISIPVLDVTDIGFQIDGETLDTPYEDAYDVDNERIAHEPLLSIEAQEGAFTATQEQDGQKTNPLLPWFMCGLLLILIAVLISIFYFE